MRRIALVLCAVVGPTLLLFPTGGSPAAQDAVDADNLQLSPSPNANGAYVTQTTAGEVRLDLTRPHPETGEQIGLNDRAVTRFDRLLRIEYNGSGIVTVWLETPTTSAHFYHETPTRPIDSRATGIRLSRGEATVVGLVVDTTGSTSQLAAFGRFEIYVGRSTGDDDGNDDGNDGEDSEEVPVDTPPADGPDDEEDPRPEPPNDDGQDDSPEPPPEVDPGDSNPEAPSLNPEPNTATGDPLPELGETPESTQVAIGGLRWVLLLVAGGILGLLTAAAIRRLSV